MQLLRILSLFAFLLGIATATAFLGYRYLALASEYRHRTFMHLQATQDALDVVRARTVLWKADAEQVRDFVDLASAQALWCIENLNWLESMAFRGLGANDALAICEADILSANRALALLDHVEQVDPGLRMGPGSPFALRLRLAPVIEEMRDHSRAFQPYIDTIEQRTWQLVTVGTTLTSLGLGIVFLVLSRLLVQAWRLEAAQKDDLVRLSQRFSLALKASGEGIALFDGRGRLVTCNQRYRELSHVRPDAIRPGLTAEQIMLGALAHGFYPNSPTTGRNRDQRVKDHMTRLRGQENGVPLALTGNRHVVEKLSTTTLGDTLITRTDVTDYVRNTQRQAEHARHLEEVGREIERHSLTDALTGLGNRRRLDQELNSGHEHSGAPLIRIDLDRFKQINDVLGHEAGDFVLCTVADILRRHTRPGDLPARIGGDEFVVACASGTTMEQAENMADRLLKDILKPVRFGNKRCVYGASFGIAAPQRGQTDATMLLRDADFALYRAKTGGRGRIEVFSDEMRRVANRDRKLADDFVEALGRNQIEPFFQTQHDARSRTLTGVEILARWRHPVEGVLPPADFLPLARQLGMEGDLDAAIFRSAVTALERLRADGIDVGTAAFNVSAARFADPEFVTQASALIPGQSHRYAFEILETVSVETMDDVVRFAIDALKEAGFRIELDDFGSDHASINSLLDIRPNALKIDRRIIQSLGDGARSAQMVGAIIDMARAINVGVVAEGVDTEEKARILAERGCDRLQGYLFSRPMPLEDLRAFCLDRGGRRASA
ncbi:putative bifunctional diguanylate cyclase/phosphodiesterase [Thetidibacter halocola]|uniref:EAL domain-containing protein n=1 Tax=Thetidibacter halocola TaxID=2827239 RepID=A0A8J7WJ49_9RHOB|nr:EAL domain-containing protein [Thetidibacter halocola]MBS0126191.1 EAL domain-containing protein [Thetidibacter halocola]